MEDRMFDEAANTPSQEKETFSKYPEYIPMVEGDHLGHIIKADTRKVTFNKEGIDYTALVYNFFVEIAPDNAQNKYEYTKDGVSKHTTGSAYKGKKIKAKGVFKIIEPKDDSNTSYLRFCESIGIPLKDKNTTIDGQEVTIKELPELTADDIQGRPVIAVIGEGKPWQNSSGQMRRSWDVKFVKKWEGGKILSKTPPKTNDDDELVF